MKTYPFAVCLLLSSFMLSINVQGQVVYPVFSGEMIFQSGTIEKSGDHVNTNLRFSAWLHVGEYIHLNFGNNIGFYTGLAMRNVGFITEEDDIKIKYRSYNLGLPIAIKLGSFRDMVYVFGGAEYEWMFHFKQKTFINDEKIKFSEWFSNRTPAFIPSVFGGLQLPKGIHLTFKYYLNNFLNHNYQGSNEYNDYTVFSNTQLWYISLSFQFNYSMMRHSPIQNAGMTVMQ